MDIIKTDPKIVGYFGAHVALSENISFGATPIVIINTLSVEMNDTGKRIIDGIKEAVIKANLNTNIITGSTEENFPVVQTGVGITVIGIKDKNLKYKTYSSDIAVLIGTPKVGNDVINNPDILTLEMINILRTCKVVHEIVPVGSKGIMHEINEIEKYNNLNFEMDKNLNIDLYESAGPATCAIITLNIKNIDILRKRINIPNYFLGKFI
ncbi:hypothetical protein JCM30566_15410 [Marinitoga arctica]